MHVLCLLGGTPDVTTLDKWAQLIKMQRLEVVCCSGLLVLCPSWAAERKEQRTCGSEVVVLISPPCHCDYKIGSS